MPGTVEQEDEFGSEDDDELRPALPPGIFAPPRLTEADEALQAEAAVSTAQLRLSRSVGNAFAQVAYQECVRMRGGGVPTYREVALCFRALLCSKPSFADRYRFVVNHPQAGAHEVECSRSACKRLIDAFNHPDFSGCDYRSLPPDQVSPTLVGRLELSFGLRPEPAYPVDDEDPHVDVDLDLVAESLCLAGQACAGGPAGEQGIDDQVRAINPILHVIGMGEILRILIGPHTFPDDLLAQLLIGADQALRRPRPDVDPVMARRGADAIVRRMQLMQAAQPDVRKRHRSKSCCNHDSRLIAHALLRAAQVYTDEYVRRHPDAEPGLNPVSILPQCAQSLRELLNQLPACQSSQQLKSGQVTAALRSIHHYLLRWARQAAGAPAQDGDEAAATSQKTVRRKGAGTAVVAKPAQFRPGSYLPLFQAMQAHLEKTAPVPQPQALPHGYRNADQVFCDAAICLAVHMDAAERRVFVAYLRRFDVSSALRVAMLKEYFDLETGQFRQETLLRLALRETQSRHPVGGASTDDSAKIRVAADRLIGEFKAFLASTANAGADHPPS